MKRVKRQRCGRFAYPVIGRRELSCVRVADELDGHAEQLRKEKVWFQKNWASIPKQSGMWVARLDVWNKYR